MFSSWPARGESSIPAIWSDLRSDGNIRYYEFDNDQFHFLSEYKTSDPQRGLGFIPRRALDVSQNEIARGFKLSTNSIEPLSFVVPRKAEGFQTEYVLLPITRVYTNRAASTLPPTRSNRR